MLKVLARLTTKGEPFKRGYGNDAKLVTKDLGQVELDRPLPNVKEKGAA